MKYLRYGGNKVYYIYDTSQIEHTLFTLRRKENIHNITIRRRNAYTTIRGK